MLTSAITQDFNALLATEGVLVANTSTGHSFRAIVTSSNQDATFTPGDQTLEETRTATCMVADCPTTGNVIDIDGEHWRVNAIQRRSRSPIRRFTLSLLPQK